VPSLKYHLHAVKFPVTSYLSGNCISPSSILTAFQLFVFAGGIVLICFQLLREATGERKGGRGVGWGGGAWSFHLFTKKRW